MDVLEWMAVMEKKYETEKLAHRTKLNQTTTTFRPFYDGRTTTGAALLWPQTSGGATICEQTAVAMAWRYEAVMRLARLSEQASSQPHPPLLTDFQQ